MRSGQPYQKHVVVSVVLHVFVLAVLVLGFESHSTMPVFEASTKNDIISAIAMESPPEITKMIQKPVKNTPPPAVVEPPKPAPEAKPPKAIEKSVAQPIDPPKKTEAIALPDKKQKQQQEKLLQQSFLEDLKKQVEQQKKIKQKSLQAAFEKEMREMKAQALEKEMRAENEKNQRTMKAQAIERQTKEHVRVSNARSLEAQGVVDKYKALILQTISQHWIVPSNANKKQSAELLIKLAPGGVVLDVQLTRSSGDPSLDSSARAAVFKASPLPVPADSEAFESFRQFVLKVRPENISTTESWMG